MINKRLVFAGGLAGIFLLGGALDARPRGVPVKPFTRPAEWAQPLEMPGLVNLHKVSDQLYRGAAPTLEGLESLKKLGVGTVVNFRHFHDDLKELEIDSMKKWGIDYHWLPTKSLYVGEERIREFFEILNNPETKFPVYIHCLHGSDRTGVMAASYRIVKQGWSRDEAIREMKKGKFGFHPFLYAPQRRMEKMDFSTLE